MARTVSVTWERVYAEDDGSRACPSVDRPATPRLLDLSTGPFQVSAYRVSAYRVSAYQVSAG
jgi:hypothetical protein